MKFYSVAVIAVLLVMFSGCGGQSANPCPTPTPSPTKTVPPTTAPVSFSLKPQSSSNETGTVNLAQSDDHWSTIVTIDVTGEPINAVQYAFFQYGPCLDIAKGIFRPNILWPLNDLVAGKSKSVYDLPLNTIDSDGPGDGTGHNPNGCTGCLGVGSTSDKSGNPNPPSTYAVTIWSYTPSGKSLVSCGEQQMN